MGDRANIVVKSGDEQICLYVHCTEGKELYNALKLALKKDRSASFQELTGMIFLAMIEIHETEHIGITQNIYDGDDNVIYVDVDKQNITSNDGVICSFK